MDDVRTLSNFVPNHSLSVLNWVDQPQQIESHRSQVIRLPVLSFWAEISGFLWQFLYELLATGVFGDAAKVLVSFRFILHIHCIDNK